MGSEKLKKIQPSPCLLVVAVFGVLCVGVAGETEVVWMRTYGGAYSDFARRLVESGDGGFIVAGWTESFDADLRDIYLLKVDADGNQVWEKTYGGPARDEALDMIRCSGGGFVVAGRAGWTESLGVRGEDVYLMKVDEEGNMIWNRTYGGTDSDRANCVVGSEDGGYVMGGITKSFGGDSYDVYVLKIDHRGEKVWERAYGGDGWDEASCIVRSGDGGFILAGETSSIDAGFPDVYLLGIDSEGNLVWERTYGGPRDDYARCISESRDSGFVVLGSTGYPRERKANILVLKIDGGGNKVWEEDLGGDENDRATWIIPSGDRRSVVLGTTSFLLPSPGCSEDIFLTEIRESPPTPIPETTAIILILLCCFLYGFGKKSSVGRQVIVPVDMLTGKPTSRHPLRLGG